MAYPYFPATYQSGYGYNTMPQQMMQGAQQIPQTQQQAVTPIMPGFAQMNGGFIHVPSERIAREYPVAPGNCVAFINDSEPFYYTKSLGTNQFDTPIFRIFQVTEVTENKPPQNEREAPSEPSSMQGCNFEDYALKADLEELREQIECLESKIESLSAKSRSRTTKEVEKNEQSS